MAGRVHSIYNVLDTLKSNVASVAEDEGISLDLLWILVRQQADFELRLIAEQLKNN